MSISASSRNISMHAHRRGSSADSATATMHARSGALRWSVEEWARARMRRRASTRSVESSPSELELGRGGFGLEGEGEGWVRVTGRG